MDFFERLSKNYNINLNEQQKKAVIHDTGPALVLAGPGSGKTTVIISRLAYLVQQKGIDPSNILSMSFNRAAAIEMEERYGRIFGGHDSKKIKFSTLHSFCYQVIRNYQKSRNLNYKLIEGLEGRESKRFVLKDIYYKVNNDNINDDELDQLVNEIGYIKNKMIQAIDNKKFNTANISQIFNEYEAYKKNNKMIDFDDMLTLSYLILNKHSDILNFYTKMYKYVQIDEGQDLSKIQFSIVKILVQPICNLFLVADDDQSIYGFRGAEPDYILGFKDQYKGACIYYLEKNYRSSRNIVEISSRLIKNNIKRYDKNHVTDNKSFVNPYIWILKSEKEQLLCLVENIKKYKSENKHGTMAILFRNNLSAVLITDVLEKSNIEFSIREGKITFFNHWFVQDILSFLKFAIDPCDVEPLKRIYYKMNRYISKNIIEYAETSENGKNLYDKMLSCPELMPYQRINIIELKTEFKKISKMTAYDALNYIEDVFKYMEKAREICDRSGYSFSTVKTLMTYLKLIADSRQSIPAFCERLACLEKILSGGIAKRSGNVTLSTIHSSKGLEYDCVFIVDMIDGEFPASGSIEEAEKSGDVNLLEEERRLFFVAITRAKTNLHIFSIQSQNGTPAVKSRFIDETERCISFIELSKFKEGTEINHKSYGKGIITTIFKDGKYGGTAARIDFNGVPRIIDLKVCMEKGIIII